MSGDKPKGKPKPHYRRVFRVLLILNFAVLGVGVFGLVFLRNSVLFLPYSLIPTAEYLYANPQPTAEFITVSYRGSDDCFEIDSAALWEPENGFIADSETVFDLGRRSRVTVDGITFEGNQLQWWYPAIAAPVLSTAAPDDPQATPSIVGSAGYADLCLGELHLLGTRSPKLTPGLHIATVETTTTSGVVHTYTWALRVP